MKAVMLFVPIFIFFFTLLPLSESMTPPSVDYTISNNQHGHIECIVHRDSTLMLELEHWRGGKTLIQRLPVVNGVAITLATADTDEEDILLLHRNNNALFITLKSSALTLQCQYNMWGMFTFEFMSLNGRILLSMINMNDCEEIIEDALSSSILEALDVL